MLTLSGYDKTNGDAYLIHNPGAPSEIKVLDTSNVDVTAVLVVAGILISEGHDPDPPTSVSYVATIFGDSFVQEALVAMDIPIPADEAGRLG